MFLSPDCGITHHRILTEYSVVATHQSFLYALMHFIRVLEELFHVDASVFSYFICILTLRLQRLFK